MNSNNTAIPSILEQIRQRHAAMNNPGKGEKSMRPPVPAFSPASSTAYAALASYLREQGVLTEIAEELVEAVHDLQPAAGTLEEQLGLAEVVLKHRWRSSPRGGGAGETHIFVGPHGSGKTTVLTKWLAQTVLLGSQSARVLRLDGHTANNAESLSLYGEVLGVPVMRSWPPQETVEPVEVTFVDLPGGAIDDGAAMEEMRQKCAAFPTAQVHLVLNGAYETSLLLAQVRAFSRLPVTDLVVAHLDEELRWGKLINLLWRTDLPLGWLGAGQNVPGGFLEARPRHLLPRGNTNKTHGSAISQAA